MEPEGYNLSYSFSLSRGWKTEYGTEYSKLHPSGSAAAPIYGTHKMHKFLPIDLFPKICLIVSSIGIYF